MTAEERARAGLQAEKKMEAPGWVRSVVLRRSFGLGKAGWGCGRVVVVVVVVGWEDECGAGRRGMGMGDGVGSEGAVDMASGVGSGTGVWFFIVLEGDIYMYEVMLYSAQVRQGESQGRRRRQECLVGLEPLLGAIPCLIGRTPQQGSPLTSMPHKLKFKLSCLIAFQLSVPGIKPKVLVSSTEGLLFASHAILYYCLYN